MNSQVSHWDTRQGYVPFYGNESCGEELWTRVPRIVLLCRKETRGYRRKKCFRVVFQEMEILSNDISWSNFEFERMIRNTKGILLLLF
jgi:hypothetical protein